jgi:hypothetical protein
MLALAFGDLFLARIFKAECGCSGFVLTLTFGPARPQPTWSDGALESSSIEYYGAAGPGNLLCAINLMNGGNLTNLLTQLIALINFQTDWRILC